MRHAAGTKTGNVWFCSAEDCIRANLGRPVVNFYFRCEYHLCLPEKGTIPSPLSIEGKRLKLLEVQPNDSMEEDGFQLALSKTQTRKLRAQKAAMTDSEKL